MAGRVLPWGCHWTCKTQLRIKKETYITCTSKSLTLSYVYRTFCLVYTILYHTFVHILAHCVQPMENVSASAHVYVFMCSHPYSQQLQCFYCLQQAKLEEGRGRSLVNLTKWSMTQLTSKVLDKRNCYLQRSREPRDKLQQRSRAYMKINHEELLQYKHCNSERTMFSLCWL